MTINVTVAAAPAYSATIAVAGRNEVAAENQPLSVVQQLLGNDHVNPWAISGTAPIWIPVSAFLVTDTYWSKTNDTNKVPILQQDDVSVVTHPTCDVSALLPPNLSGTLKLKGATISLAPSTLHSSLPVSLPSISLDSYPVSDYTATGSFTQIATVTDAPVSLIAYETPHVISCTCNHLIVPTERYFLRILGEHSTNALNDLKITNITLSVGL